MAPPPMLRHDLDVKCNEILIDYIGLGPADDSTASIA